MKRTFIVLIACTLSAGILLAQKAPQTPEYRQWMQDIQTQIRTFNEVYSSVPWDVPKAKVAIDALAKDFANVEAHFQKANKADAVNWAKDAKSQFIEAQDRLKRNDLAYALNLIQLAQKNCKSCHEVYRPQPAKTGTSKSN